MKYCRSCGQNVQPVKKFSIGWFLFNLLTVVGGGIYILYWAFAKKKTCPICGGNDFDKPLSAQEITKLNKDEPIEHKPQVNSADKAIDWLANSNSKMESLNERLQKKNEAITQAREEKKRLKAQQKLEKVNG